VIRAGAASVTSGQVTRRLTDPLPFAGAVVGVIVIFLGLDQWATSAEQLALGAATWGVLLLSCGGLDRQERARVALVVLVATIAEVLGSIVLGAYIYRLDNLPAFVPPGHGLVYLAGLRISQSAAVARHREAFVRTAALLVAAWAVAGLTLLGRTDVLGAAAALLLLFVLLRGRTPALYAGVFLVVGFLELYGTAVGAWQWADAVPGTALSAGNPPSGIASIYVLFDVAAIALAPRVLSSFDTLVRRLPLLPRAAESA
jgi:hypothetical protein